MTVPSSTKEEVEKEHLQAFGSTLGPLYHALENEVIWLHAKWLEYRKLYAKSEERIDLLNEAGGFFFRVVQKVLWEDVLLHIARLTDPPKHTKFGYLTLKRLPAAVPDPCLRGELNYLLTNALERSEFAREWRNKRLAHLDLSLAIDAKAAPLPGVSREHVDEALGSFGTMLNRLRSSYSLGEVGYGHFVTQADANTLVHHLAVAARFEGRRRQRLVEGKALPEDLEPPPTV